MEYLLDPMGYAYVLDRSLAQGSRPPEGSTLAPTFDTLVLSAMEYQPPPQSFPGVQAVVHVPLDDAKPSRDEIRRAMIAGRYVADRIRRGHRALVTCHMGKNRSGLVTGLALMELGWPAKEAVRAVKAARGPIALSNPDFVKVLETYEEFRQRHHTAAKSIQYRR